MTIRSGGGTIAIPFDMAIATFNLSDGAGGVATYGQSGYYDKLKKTLYADRDGESRLTIGSAAGDAIRDSIEFHSSVVQSTLGIEQIEVPALSNDTTVATDYTQPAALGSVTISVTDAAGFAVGQLITVWALDTATLALRRFGGYTTTAVVGNDITAILNDVTMASKEIDFESQGVTTLGASPTIPAGAIVTNKTMLQDPPLRARVAAIEVGGAASASGRNTIAPADINNGPILAEGEVLQYDSLHDLMRLQFTGAAGMWLNIYYSKE